MRKSVLVLLLAAVMMLFAVSCAEEAHEHTWDEGKVTTPATCTDPGVKTYTCECGETKTEAIPALGHTWDEGKVTIPATCTDPGVKTYTCQNDKNHTKTEAVAAIGHNWDEGVVTTPATCEDAGVKTYTCQNNPEHTKTESVAALGHNWNEGVVTTDPTETTDGEKTYTCQNNPEHTKTEVVPKLAISVSTFAEFEQAFTDIRAEGETCKIIRLSADIAWDSTKYDGSDAAHIFSPDMTGLTLNLNEHSITGIANKAFAPTGNTFTIKNGSVLLATGLSTTFLKAITVNFSEDLTYKDYTTEAEQAKAITFDGITTNGCLYLGGGVFRIKDSTINSYGTKTRGLCAYSAYVDVTNSTIVATNGEVAIHVRDTVLNLNNGTTVTSPTHGIQAYYKSTVTTTGTVTVTAAGAGYDIYLNYGPNTLTIGSGTTISGATKGVFALTYGDTVTIANGATITGPAGGVEPKYTAAGYTKASGTASTNGYVGWSNGNKNTTDTATITDNRVLE